MMINNLGEHDPSLFTRTDSTFIDLYMKSGMYITEIVKKLFNKERWLVFNKLDLLQNEESKILEVDTIILCAGQTPLKELYEALESSGKKIHVIGGADIAAELDAKRAIDQGSRLAARL